MMQFRVLSEEQIQNIHLASLELLERTGVKVFQEEALDLLGKAGAGIENDNLVKIPASLIKWALQQAPERVVISDRLGNRTLLLEDKKVYYGPGTDTQNVYDPYSGERRPAKLEDVGNAAKVCDYAPNIHFVASMGMASDLKPQIADRHHFLQMAANTTKPIMFTAWDLEGLKDIYQICVTIKEGESNFQRNPFVIHYAEPSTPLEHSRDTIDKLLFCVEHDVPVIYSSGPVMGASAPIRLAGALALSNAEYLSGLVIAQLKSKGAPVIYGGGSSPMDMKTTVAPYSGPESWLNKIALAELAQWYDLPSFGTGGCSDAKVFDQQAASEATSTLIFNALAGHNLIHDIGYLESGMTASYEEILLTDEIISQVEKTMKGIDVSEDTLSVDVIDGVGPGGHFMTHPNTQEQYKDEVWYPRFFDRKNYDGWAKDGSRSLYEVLNEKVKWILENHCPEALSEDVRAEIDDLLGEVSI